MKQLNLFKKRKRTPGKTWGRPKSTHIGARQKRETFLARHPLHITLRLREGLPNLRTLKGSKVIRHSIEGAQNKGLRVLHFAILSNHIHMLVEGQNPQTLHNSMKSLCSRLGIHLRRWASQTAVHKLDSQRLGLFRGRYHVQILKSPQQIKHALQYILLNPAKHFKKSPYIDAFTSGAMFKDWKKLIGRELPGPSILDELQKRLSDFLSPPTLWLTTSGWAKAVH